MKKLLLVSFLLCILLCACTRKDPSVTTGDMTTIAPADVTTEGVETTALQPDGLSFTVRTETLSLGKGVAVQYDVLTCGDAELDELLLQLAERELARYIPNASSVSANGGSADYTVKLARLYTDDTIVSAEFSGEYSLFYEDSFGMEESGSVLYTVLVDPKSKKLLTTADVVNDFAKLKQAYADGRFAPYGLPYAKDLDQYQVEYGIYPYVYLDDGLIWLYITEYVDGIGNWGTAYSMPREEAADFLNY